MNIGQVFLGIGIVFLAKYAINKARDKGQDLLANTPLGATGIVRSVEAQKAAKSVLDFKWLTHAYWDKATSPENHVYQLYNLNLMEDSLADDLAKLIIDANYRIFDNNVLDRLAAIGLFPLVGAVDDPNKVLDAIGTIKNQVQGVQVAYWYNKRTGGKELNKGLQWLPDSYMIEVANYLDQIPTGVQSKTTGMELDKLPNF